MEQLAECQVVAVPRSPAASFSSTFPLTRGLDPADGANWPAWAVAAMTHSLAASEDVFVTYISDVGLFKRAENRTKLSGVEIVVHKLFVWQWGPEQVALNSILMTE